MSAPAPATNDAPAAAPVAPAAPRPNLVKRVLGGAGSAALRCGTSGAAQACLFLLGVLWCGLHQWVCVSTTEPKMRGTYFSEAALLSESKHVGFTTADAHVAYALARNYSRVAADAAADITATDRRRRRLDWLRAQLLLADPGRVTTFEQHFQSPPLQLDAPWRVPGRPAEDGSSSPPMRTNIFAVLEPRVGTTRSEAVVVVAKHRAADDQDAALVDSQTPQEGSPGGVGVLLALARRLATHDHLSKRVVFVLCDGGTAPDGWDGGIDAGVREWVRAYVAGEIVTAGALRAAVLLDVRPGDDPAQLGAAVQGSNGLLSNLDLFNVVAKARRGVRKQAAPVVAPRPLAARADEAAAHRASLVRRATAAVEGLVRALLPAPQAETVLGRHMGNQPRWADTVDGTLRFMRDVAFGPTRGGHAHFLDHGIDAITLSTRPVGSDGDGDGAHVSDLQATEALGAHLETLVRSMSMLSETIHQSFWQYILPHPKFMITVEEYGLTLLLLTVCVPLRTLADLGYGSGASKNKRKKKKNKKKQQQEDGEVAQDEDEDEDEGEEDDGGAYFSPGSIPVRGNALAALAVVVGVAAIEMVVLHALRSHQVATGQSLLDLAQWWLAAFLGGYTVGLCMLLMLTTTKTRTVTGGMSGADGAGAGADETAASRHAKLTRIEDANAWKSLKIATCGLFYALHCFGLGVRNYPFAFFTSLFMVPLVTGAAPAAAAARRSLCGRVTRALHALLLVASSPPALLLLWCPWAVQREAGSVWAEQLRGWAELGSFHVPYLVTLYLPFHLLSARITWG